jgi:hypothetical protein
MPFHSMLRFSKACERDTPSSTDGGERNVYRIVSAGQLPSMTSLPAWWCEKDETHAEACTRHIGPKILKICTFKVKLKFRGGSLASFY